MFGSNPRLPSVLTDKVPALEGTTMSALVGKHIEALHLARTAFTKSECSERIRRALRKQIRPSGNTFKTGEKVYYKRPDSRKWRGPGVVIGQDGAVVFVRHGGICVRVHQCRLTKVNTDRSEGQSVSNDVQESQSQDEKEEKEQLDNHFESEDSTCNEAEEMDKHCPRNDFSDTIKISKDQVIQYKIAGSGEKCVAKVLGRAGKATGTNRNWFNLKFVEPESQKDAEISVDLSKVQELETLETDVQDSEEDSDITLEDNVMVLTDVKFKEAKEKELDSWKTNNVYIERKDIGQKCISTRWICSLKDTTEGTIQKARLVARGFEEADKDNIPKDSPTCGSDSLRLVLAMISQRNWNLHTMDIKTAFLQGSEIEREICVRPPLKPIALVSYGN